MCPACIATAALIVAGATSAGGLGALVAKNLRGKTGAEIIDLLASLAAEHGATVIVATHDVGLADRAPRRLAMRDGRLLAAVAA